MPLRPATSPISFAAVGALAGIAVAGPRSNGLRRLAAGTAGGLVGVAAWMLLFRRPHPSPGPVTQATVPSNPADTPIGPPGSNLDARLDEAIQETFPSSDPISLRIE